MTYRYELISGGFLIYPENSTKPIIKQPVSPITHRPYLTEEAEKIAKYMVYKLEHGTGFYLTPYEEETILSTDTITDEFLANLFNESQLIQQTLRKENDQTEILKDIRNSLDLILNILIQRGDI